MEYPVLGNQWYEIQEKVCVLCFAEEVTYPQVFTRWMNTHLKKREPPLELPLGSLTRGGLDNGVMLWECISQIDEEPIPQKPNRRGQMRIHYINNVNISLQFLNTRGLKLVGIGAEGMCFGVNVPYITVTSRHNPLLLFIRLANSV
jgi:hypothetical protein